VSRFVTERCVTVRPVRAVPAPSPDVVQLARALVPYLPVRPSDVAATLARCGIDPRPQPIAR
jgi:hypothetical protein